MPLDGLERRMRTIMQTDISSPVSLIGGGDASNGHKTLTKVYTTSDLGNYLTQGFQSLWEKQLLFDCTIVVEGQEFELHKGLLIALSPYFQSMFTSGFEEAAKSKVELKGVTPSGFKEVINFLYTSQISINESTLQDTMEAAAHLQIPGALDFCGKFIQSSLNTINCFDFLRLAHIYDHIDGKDAILDFIAWHSVILKERDEFLNLPSDMFSQVLASEKLPFRDENDVLKIAVDWLLENKDYSQEDLMSIMSCVRYALLSEEDIRKQIERVQDLKNNDAFMSLVQKALKFHEDLVNLPTSFPRAQYRPAQVVQPAFMFIRVAEGSEATERRVHVFNIQENGLMQEEPAVEDYPRALNDTAVSCLQNFVFVTGGCEYVRPGRGYMSVSSVYRFDFLSKCWVEVASMQHCRGLHASTVLSSHEMIVIGGVGRGDENRTFLDSVELYDMKSNTWRPAANFPYKVCNIQASSVNNIVYACGGTLDIEPRPRVNSYRLHMYDHTNDRWVERSSMHCKKQWHVMQTCGDRIFVFGGVSSQDMEFFPPAQPQFFFAKIVEVYNPVVNQWTIVNVPNYIQQAISRPIGGGFCIRNRLYLIGQRRLITYDSEGGTWSQIDFEYANIGVSAVTVKIPADQQQVVQSLYTINIP